MVIPPLRLVAKSIGGAHSLAGTDFERRRAEAFTGWTQLGHTVNMAITGAAATFNTWTVKLLELAVHVRATIDDLRVRGEFG